MPDSSEDLTSNWNWFKALSPSPVHWLILMFAVAGATITLTYFISDMFTSPRAPPRSAYEVHKWKMRRQLRICLNLVLFGCFCGWGATLFYFTYTQQQCAASAPSIYRLSLLLLLVFWVLIGLAVVLFTCVCIDCCISGRMRLVLLLSDEPTRVGPTPGQDGGYYVGATKETAPRTAASNPSLDRTSTQFSKGDASARLLPEQAV